MRESKTKFVGPGHEKVAQVKTAVSKTVLSTYAEGQE